MNSHYRCYKSRGKVRINNRNPGNEKPLSLHPLTPEEVLFVLMQANPEENRMNWTADMMCTLCTYIDPGRYLEDMTEEEALEATLDCPNCEMEGRDWKLSSLH